MNTTANTTTTRKETAAETSVLVRHWDSQNMICISLKEWENAEKNAGKTSAFAETRAVLSNGLVDGTNMKVEKYLQYRNS